MSFLDEKTVREQGRCLFSGGLRGTRRLMITLTQNGDRVTQDWSMDMGGLNVKFSLGVPVSHTTQCIRGV
jgi:hypothetical protein